MSFHCSGICGASAGKSGFMYPGSTVGRTLLNIHEFHLEIALIFHWSIHPIEFISWRTSKCSREKDKDSSNTEKVIENNLIFIYWINSYISSLVPCIFLLSLQKNATGISFIFQNRPFNVLTNICVIFLISNIILANFPSWRCSSSRIREMYRGYAIKVGFLYIVNFPFVVISLLKYNGITNDCEQLLPRIHTMWFIKS